MAINIHEMQERVLEIDDNIFVTLTVPEGVGFKLDNELNVDTEVHKKIKEHADKGNEFCNIQVTQSCFVSREISVSREKSILLHTRFLTFKKPFREDQESAEETHPAVEG